MTVVTVMPPLSARRVVLALVALLVTVLTVLTHAPSASAEDGTSGPRYAPLDRPGPALRVPAADLRAAMECHGKPGVGPRAVYLNPATSVTPEENYGWNWEPLFDAQGRYWCTMTMPHHTFGDIQTAAEYIVHAIRTMYRRTGEKVAILGHSQGGMSGRWALRFWPDLRDKVSEVIGMAPSNHGTKSLVQCVPGVTRCVPAVWQQSWGSHFVQALNSRAETFAGIDYTNIYTRNDEVVTPPAEASGLTTGAGRISNVEVQDVCPLDPYEHVLMGTVSPAVHALVMDALTHRGPADPARVDRAACNQLYMPGIDPTDLQANAAPLLALPSLLSTSLPEVTFSGAPMLDREPPLRCYVLATRCRR
ncbi:MAG TPA: lipase [Nocardioides sp.]|nr:lipase [Nocardioides sp.]